MGRWFEGSRLGAGFAAVALISAACGGGASPPPGSAAPGSPAGSVGGAASPAGTPAGTSDAGTSAAPVEGGAVTVIGTWGGDEEAAFLEMVKPFEDDTGIDVQYTGTRDLNAVLTTGVASGILPDLAGLPGPGQMAEFARAGKLVDLGTVLEDVDTYTADTAPAFVELGTIDGKLSGVFIKSAVKGLIWYNPANFTGEPPATWE